MTEERKHTALRSLLIRAAEYAGIIAAAWILFEATADNYVDSRIEAYNKVHSGSKKSFREALSDKLKIPVDEVVIEIGKWHQHTEKFREDFYKVLPHIEEELNSITPRLVIINGREFWVAEDGEYYRVSRDNEQGVGFYFKQGQWHQIFY